MVKASCKSLKIFVLLAIWLSSACGFLGKEDSSNSEESAAIDTPLVASTLALEVSEELQSELVEGGMDLQDAEFVATSANEQAQAGVISIEGGSLALWLHDDSEVSVVFPNIVIGAMGVLSDSSLGLAESDILKYLGVIVASSTSSMNGRTDAANTGGIYESIVSSATESIDEAGIQPSAANSATSEIVQQGLSRAIGISHLSPSLVASATVSGSLAGLSGSGVSVDAYPEMIASFTSESVGALGLNELTEEEKAAAVVAIAESGISNISKTGQSAAENVALMDEVMRSVTVKVGDVISSDMIADVVGSAIGGAVQAIKKSGIDQDLIKSAAGEIAAGTMSGVSTAANLGAELVEDLRASSQESLASGVSTFHGELSDAEFESILLATNKGSVEGLVQAGLSTEIIEEASATMAVSFYQGLSESLSTETAEEYVDQISESYNEALSEVGASTVSIAEALEYRDSYIPPKIARQKLGPANLKVSDLTKRSATLSFDPVEGAIGYSLFYKLGSDASISDNEIKDVSSPYVHSGLQSAKYHYIVVAIFPGGVKSQASANVIADTEGQKPSIDNFTLTPSENGISLTWDAVEGAVSYTIYHRNPDSLNLGQVNEYETTNTSYQVNGIVPEWFTGAYATIPDLSEQTFYVRATMSNGESSQDSPTLSDAAIGPLYVQGGINRVNVSWHEVPGATSYTLYWSTSTPVTKTNGTKVEGVTSPYAHPRADSETIYYKVFAEGTSFSFTEKSGQSYQLIEMPPSIGGGVENVSATGHPGRISVSWTEPYASPEAVILLMSETPTVDNSSPMVLDVSSPYHVTKLPAGKTIYFRVMTVISASTYVLSDIVSATSSAVTEKVAATSDLAVTTASSGTSITNTVTWSENVDAHRYNLYFSTTGPATAASNLIENVSSPYQHTGLEKGKTYYYAVVPINPIGVGELSNSASVTTPDVPLAPTWTTSSPGDEKANLAWALPNGSTAATAYKLYWQAGTTVSPANGTKIDLGTTSYEHLSLTAGQTYAYVVVATNAFGDGAPSAVATVTPTLDTVAPTYTVSPADGSALTNSDSIVITFSETMNTSVVGANIGSGTLNNGKSINVSWSTTNYPNDTVTVSPVSDWNYGEDLTFVLGGVIADVAGNTLGSNQSITYDSLADGFVYVSDANGNDSNSGTKTKPFKTIQAGITQASTLNSGHGTAPITAVRVAKGTYTGSSYPVVTMAYHLDLIGGFDHTNWDAAVDESEDATIIAYTGSYSGSNGSYSFSNSSWWPSPTYVVSMESYSMIKGFTVKGAGAHSGGGAYTAGIRVSYQYSADVNVIVDNCFVNGGNGTVLSAGIYGSNFIKNLGVTIRNSTINSGDGGQYQFGILLKEFAGEIKSNTLISASQSVAASVLSAGIYAHDRDTVYSTGSVHSNTLIRGGIGDKSYGINSESWTGDIYGNVIKAGGNASSTLAAGIFISEDPATTEGPSKIYQNDIYGGVAASTYGLYLADDESDSDRHDVYRNRIHGGDATSLAQGVFVKYYYPMNFNNNQVFGGTASSGHTIGIQIDSENASYRHYFRNNTIVSGSASSWSHAYYTGGFSVAYFENNLFKVESAGATGYCLAGWGFATTGIIDNNGFISCANGVMGSNIYDHANSGATTPSVQSTITDLNGLSQASSNVQNGVDSVTIGFETDSVPTNGNWALPDYKLSGGSTTEVTQGGIVGSTESPAWSFSIDYDNTSRTSPWSIGAFEKD